MENKKKLAAVIACRNNSSRLYAKPLQLLDIEKNISIIEFIIKSIKKYKCIDSIVLAVSSLDKSEIYENIAKKKKIRIFYGDENNVLKRTVLAAEKVKATDILRVTSESPYPYLKDLNYSWRTHKQKNFDATFLDNVIDGCGFEIIKLKTLQRILKKTTKFQNEHITNYIRLNKKKFLIQYISSPKFLKRHDIRLTVDNPEDLILCREIYKIYNKNLDHKGMINFLDKNEHLKELVKKYLIDGYSTMYL